MRPARRACRSGAAARIDGLVDDRLVPGLLLLGLLGDRPRGTRRAGASMPPGAVATTRMPCSAYSQASDAVSAFTPPLAAAYGTRLRPRVATEDTLTIMPRPCASMIGSTRPAAPHRREQRAPDLGLDLRLGVVRVRLGPDRAAHVVDQDVDPAEPVAGRGHGGRRAEVALQVGGERDASARPRRPACPPPRAPGRSGRPGRPRPPPGPPWWPRPRRGPAPRR